jgi:beta-galactosidase beta subunit
MLMEAEKAASRLDNLNKELERKLERLEALRVEETLSGKANVHVQKQEETPEEYAEKVLRGDIVGTDEY